jgi:Spy/CpxP family protein refolding chaperone
MKQSHKFAAGVVASLGLGIAVAVVYAQPGPMGGGMGPQMKGGMQHGMKGGMGPGAMKGGPAGPAAAQQLMTPEERTAIIEKMRNAKTPEERQQIAAANQAEMQKRAKEKGITLPEPHGPGAGFGPSFAPPFATPAR